MIMPKPSTGVCAHCRKLIHRDGTRQPWRHDDTDLAMCSKSNGDQAEPTAPDPFDSNPLIAEIITALRILGADSRMRATVMLNSVPLVLTEREREAVLRRFDTDYLDPRNLGNSNPGW